MGQMRLKKIMLPTVLGLGLMALPLRSMAANLKVGTVDMIRALNEVKKGKSAQSVLDKEVAAKKKKFEGDQANLRKLGEDFQKKSAVMSEKARTEKGMELQQKMGELQQSAQQAQIELESRRVELTKPILEGLRALVPEVARKRNLELVFDASSINPGGPSMGTLVYAVDQTDITEELIKLYDEKNPK
jgi:outer membrane protein